MEAKIQMVNYNGRFDSEKYKANKLSNPESFDDYTCNIIDLSNELIWENNDSNCSNINCMKDIECISSMIKIAKNNILIVLPQNIRMKYWYNKNTYRFLYSKELKTHLPFIENILRKLDNSFQYINLLYNKTTTLINKDKIPSDFILNNSLSENIITYNSNNTCVTTVSHNNIFFTTLKLITVEEYNNFLRQIGLISETTDIPDWVYKEYYFDDQQLNAEKQKLKESLANIQNEIDIIDSKLNNNLYFKSCLYQTGEELVIIVNKILQQIVNYNSEEFKDKKEEDFLFEIDGNVFIGEIKGINTNVKREHVSQTDNHRNIYLDIEGNENKSVFAIAIINRQRNKPVKERDKINNDIIQIAKSRNVLIVPIETLLDIFEAFKQNKITSKEILNMFINQTGELIFQNKK